MNIRLLTLLVSAVLLSLLLTACGEDPQPPYNPQSSRPQGSAAKAGNAAALPEQPVEETEEVYVYDPTGTRDPFKSPLGTISDLSSTGDIPLTPLQRFDLDQLRVIGVIVGKGEPRAMVIAPDNKSFVLKKGTKVGRNNGTVVAITTETIQVEEQYLDYAGDIKSTIQEIKLPKRGGVK